MDSGSALRLLDDQHCAECMALVVSRNRIVHGYGDPRSGVVFVGEAPGRHGADRTGIPFHGDRSGRALQRILIELGLADPTKPPQPPLLRCFVTNVVRCCPPGNRTPMRREQHACRGYLDRELDLINPWLIVPVGRLALQVVAARYLQPGLEASSWELEALARQQALQYASGAIRTVHAQPLRVGAQWIVPLIHPSRISHAQIEAFLVTMRRILAA